MEIWLKIIYLKTMVMNTKNYQGSIVICFNRPWCKHYQRSQGAKIINFSFKDYVWNLRTALIPTQGVKILA
jgi:hypothetical protein